MKKLLFIIFFLLVKPWVVFGQQTNVNIKQLNAGQWRFDLKFLYDSLQDNHLNLYHFTPKTVFDEKYNVIYEEIPKLSNDQIYLRFKQFISLTGDGHTMLSEPQEYRKFPLDFFIFDKQVVLIRSADEFKVALGLPLVSINNYPIAQIRDSLNTIIDHGESTAYLLKQQVDRLNIAEYLSAFGFISNSDVATFEFRKGNQSIKIKAKALTKEVNKPIKWEWAYHPLPLFLTHLQESGTSISHQSLDDKTYYINFSSYPSWEVFEKISEDIYDKLNHQKEVNKIIIDMRLNGGGNFDKGLKLMLPMFLNFNALHPGVKYYLVIGRETFSAGMSNAVHFKNCLNATLVGEPTGANPNGYQEIKWFTLPNSKLNASCSLLYYTFQKKATNGVRPDKRIEPSFTDYKIGNDPVLNWIIKKH